MRLIDADALIARCGSWYTEEGTEEGFIGTLKNIVDMMPTIEPERKKGKWECHYSRPNVYEDLYWHCSECGYKNDNQYANVYHKFCPNCGADMRGEQE